MIIKYFILSVSYVCTYGLSIGSVSGSQPLDKSARPDDLFPDWVPFKNKHGDELGKFKAVKSRVKKRLAPPLNFLIRNLEPEGDYYDKGGDGGSDSEDYFEKKDWSDLHRPAEFVTDKINHNALSEIDGVLSILAKETDQPLVQGVNKNRDRLGDTAILSLVENQPVVGPPETGVQPNESDQKKRENTNKNYAKKPQENTEKENFSTEEPHKEENKEEMEDEVSKKSVLDVVDELKMRHIEEQKDRANDEELYKELFKKYAVPHEDSKEKTHRKKSHKQVPIDYDEYEDQGTSVNDKYKLKPIHKEVPSLTSKPSTESSVFSTDTPRPRTSKYIETGKLSVFRNPQLYMVYDDAEETTSTTTVKPRRHNTTSKYSSYKGTTMPSLEDDERISLVPVDAKEGEPTLFLPTKRKERKLKNKFTTPSAIRQIYQETTIDTSAADSRQSVDVTEPTAGEAVTTTEDTDTTASDHVTHIEPKDYHTKKGGGKEHHSEHSEEQEEHGKKVYEGHHENHKTSKGNHDKEDHLGKYDDHGGVDKHYHDESGHSGEHVHEEHGKKHAKYEESGKHSKGHSTKGSHDIHKKEEYEKNVEFFEEEGDFNADEQFGGYNSAREHKKRGYFKNGNTQAGHNDRSKGETGSYGKGRNGHYHQGHQLAEGHDSHGKQYKDHVQKEGKAGGKKWIYHHGFPAKTANLAVIDRRGDQYYHGNHYYG